MVPGICLLNASRMGSVFTTDKFREMIEIAMQKGSHNFEWIHKRLNGEEFAATVLLTRMQLQGEILIQANVRDISDKKWAEAALQGSEKRLMRAEEIARFGHWELSLGEKKMRASRGAKRIYGLEGMCHRLSPPFLSEVPSVHMWIKCLTHANFK